MHGFIKSRFMCTNLLEFVNFTFGMIDDEGAEVDLYRYLQGF